MRVGGANPVTYYTELVILFPCIVDGCWSQWGSWSCCTQTCGRNVSTQNRTRYCNDPMPMLGGKLCDGKSIDIQIVTCNDSSIDACSEIMNNTIETNVSQTGAYMNVATVCS